MSRKTKAFALNAGLAAIATNSYAEAASYTQPFIVIGGLVQGVSIHGKESLLSLQEAIDFALRKAAE